MNVHAQDPIAILFSYDVGYAAYVSAEICADAKPSTVVLTKNFDGGAEIGSYRIELGESNFRLALGALRRSGYERSTVPPVAPETPFMVIGERREDEDQARLCHFPLPHLPPEVIELAGELEGFVRRVRQHRSRVVTGRAAWQKPSFHPREPLAARVTLESVGPLPVVIGNPLDPTLDWIGLNLVVWQPRSGAGQDSVSLNPTHLRLPPGAPASGELTLAPGKSMSFGLEKKVYLPPGDYEGCLVYMNVIDRPGDPQFVRGQLFLDLGPFTIEAPRAS